MNIIYTSTILVISLSLLYTSRIFTVINIIAIVFGAFASFLTLLISAIVWKIGSIFSDNIYLYAILAIVFQEITRAVLYYIFLYGEEQILKLESKKNTIKEHSTPMYKNLLEISIATGIGMGLTYQVLPGINYFIENSNHNSVIVSKMIEILKPYKVDEYLLKLIIPNTIFLFYHFLFLILNMFITFYMWDSLQKNNKSEFSFVNIFKTHEFYLSILLHLSVLISITCLYLIDTIKYYYS